MSARVSKTLVGLLLVAVVVLAGALLWQRHRTNEAELQADVNAGRVLSAIFAEAQELRVATLRGQAVARSRFDGRLFDPEQVTKAPYSVSYFVDLGKVGQGDYAWNPAQKVMTVTIPDVTVEPPSVDISRQEVRQQGLWISRQAAVAMQSDGQRRLVVAADTSARSDENLRRAREAARVAVSRMVRDPLAAADLGDVTVRVAFPWETGRSTDRQDRSRSLDQVYANQY